MNQTINLIHLKFFCDAVAYESISEAAKKNYISQSAVSQAITKLETIFGVQLIFQNRQKLQATEEGKILFERAPAIFRGLNEIFDTINQTKNEVCGSIEFITTKSLGMSFIAPSYKRIKQNLPLLDFKIKMGGLNTIRTALKREEAEFAIVINDHIFDQFEKQPLTKGLFRLFQFKDALSDQIDEGVFVCERDCMYVHELKKYLEEQGHANPIQDAISGWELAARFTDLNIGIGFFPDYIISQNRYPNIIPHPLEIPPFEYEICAIYNKGIKLSKAAQEFLNQFTLE